MKTKRMMIMLCFTLFSVASLLAKDLKTVTFNVPQMVCENCEKKVKDNIRFEKGVKEIVTNVEKKTVAITYDADKTNVEALVNGFKKIKYDVTCADSQDCGEKKDCKAKAAGCCNSKK